mgnify:CR=1 FL=1
MLAELVGVPVAAITFSHESFMQSQGFRGQIKEGTERLKIPFLDLNPALAATGLGRGLWVYPTDQHPNEIAHKIAAQEIETFLKREKLLSSSDQTK